MDIRCEHRLHGRLNGGVLEVQCRSALCGKRDGVVVIHYFQLKDVNGQLTIVNRYTKRFQDPMYGRRMKEGTNVVGPVTAVRRA